MSEQQKKPGDANAITRSYFDSILVEERLIDSVEADLHVELFGEQFDTPIMMPAFSHLDKWIKNGRNSMVEYAAAAKTLGAVNFVGMRENEEMDAIFETGARTVRIVKPYADRDKIFSQLAYAKEHGAIAVGMDIDHIFGMDGKYDVVIGEKMASQSMEMIREYVEFSRPLPFVIKGVLSVTDALKCKECGVYAILVSHHSGRMPFAVPPLRVLPKIREAVGGSMKIFVDCGVNSGVDAFKALALGADAVAVGRAMQPALASDGREGVISYVETMNQKLATMMNFTCSKTVAEISPDVLILP